MLATELSHFMIYQSFCYSELRHSLLLQRSDILYYNAQPFFDTLLSHFCVFYYSELSYFVIMSTIFHCYSDIGYYLL
jgi:hypothetical protein